ncbi:MAG: MFS transporter [Pseudolabrys sp.]
MSTTPPGTERQLTVVIALMAVAAFCSGFSQRISDPLLPQIATDFGVSVGQAAAIVTAYAVPYGLTQAFAGVFGDRIGKCQAVALTCAVSCLLVLLCVYSQSLTQLTIARFICAPAAATIVPLGMAYVGDTVAYEKRQPILARFLAGQMIGMIAGQAAGGIIGDLFGWRAAFLALSFVFIFASIALMTQILLRNPWTARVRREGGRGPGMIAEYRMLLGNPWPRFVVIAVFVEGAIFFAGMTYIAADLNTRFGLSYSVIGLIVAGFGIGSVIYASTVSWVVAALGPRGMVLAGGAIVMLGFLVLAGESAWQIAPVAVITLGFGYYLLHNTLQTNATQMLPEARGTAVAGFSSALFLGQSAGVALAAPIVDRAGAVPVFLIVAVLWPIMAVWIWRRLARRETA